jgi:hypothetical protein
MTTLRIERGEDAVVIATEDVAAERICGEKALAARPEGPVDYDFPVACEQRLRY